MDWSEKWQLPFNISKCKVLHIGRCNPCRRYKIKGNPLKSTNEEKDLGILVDNELKFHRQTAAAVKKANASIGMIKKSFSLLDHSIVPLLYKSLVRPHLEYANLIWGPFYKGDIKLVEKIQRRSTKMIDELKSLPYVDRLRSLNLPSLQYRRRRSDLIFAHKIFNGQVKVKPEKIFTMATRTIRGHPFRLRKKRTTTALSSNSFSNRIVNDWNGLPEDIVATQSLDLFKSKVDKWLQNDIYVYHE